ncbi:DEAD/DEAH box helicase family protein [Helicobacter pullorum]|uniref:DEAD/DEAH box helicase family protein n=1 Tax=Helicobacter pullorum TaxID=35818 RepID=UPI00242F01A1|nr:DEAD/DEAH box helicase family protein [Helicobacter pullorum]
MPKHTSIKKHLLLSEICNNKRVQYKESYENYDLKSFSADISLQDYQIASLQNALIALELYMCYKDSDYIKQRGEKLYRIYKEQYKDCKLEKEEINRASFWMATGSGKSIVMIKLLSLLGKAIREKKIPNKPIMLLAPNDTILAQFKDNVAKYNNYNADFITLKELREYESATQGGLFGETTVFIARSDLLDCAQNVGKDKSAKRLDYKNYCNNEGWYILLDEAHRGDSKESIRKYYINEIACGDKLREYEGYSYNGYSRGFIFNFSATFSDELDFFTCAFNYNLEKFNNDGYGKNIAVLDSHLKSFSKESDESERIIRIIEGFILFSAIKQSKKELLRKARDFSISNIQYHNPLIIAVSDKVNTQDAGIKLYFKAILQILKEDKDIQEIAKNLYEKLKNQELYFAKDVLSDEFLEYVKNTDSKSVRENIFYASEPSHLECFRANDKELAFKSKNANEPFMLLNIAEAKKWEKEHLLELGVESFKDLQKSYFKNINNNDSSINIMLGSKVFSEGWDSNRVNLIYFINIGSKNAKKYVLQTIGRGVRIEPFSNVRKRMRYCDIHEYSTKQILSPLACGLETLFILASDNEAIKYILEEIESFITQYPLKGFKKTNELNPLPAPKYKEIESKERKYKIGRSEAQKLKAYIQSFDEDILTLSKCVIHKECSYDTLREIKDFLDDKSERIIQYGDFQEFDKNKTFSHIHRILNVRNRELKEFVDLSDEINHYQSFKTTLGESFANEINAIIKTLNAHKALKTREDLQKEGVAEEYIPAILESEAKKQSRIIDSYQISAKLREHYYNPLIIYSKNDRDSGINFAINEESEKEFLQDLEEFLQRDSKELIKYEWCFSKLVENIDTIYIPYFDNEAQSERKFYPDFIFWFKSKENGEYTILFIDPKGLKIEANPRDKIKGFEDIFKDKEFLYRGKKIQTYLFYYNKKVGEFIGFEKYKKSSVKEIIDEIVK